MDSLPCSQRAQFCAIFPRDGFEAGAVMDLDKAGWTDGTLIKNKLKSSKTTFLVNCNQDNKLECILESIFSFAEYF